jgi:hypothetical protein
MEPPAASPIDAAPPSSVDSEPDLPPAEGYADEGGDSWYDAIEFSAFADAYFSLNYNFPKPQSGRNLLRQFDSTNGFALSWVGVNASYPADPVGGTISLRFGPTARAIGNSCFARDSSKCDAGQGIENVKQAFASWKPLGGDSSFQLDLGKFDTPFGAEVAESHLNMNYTRGMLFASQPLFHTGLRASFALGDAVDFKLMAVNGWNNSIDNNVGKSLGAQVNFHVKGSEDQDLLTASVGYMGGPERDDVDTITCEATQHFDPASPSGCAVGTGGETSGSVDRATTNSKGLRHLIDLVIAVNPIERLRLLLNADLGIESTRDSADPSQFNSAKYFGVMLGARVAVVDEFGVALRGEYFKDERGFLVSQYPGYEMNLFGGTLTLDYLPSDFLTIRLDNRLDWADRQIFPTGVRDNPNDLTGTQFTTTLGVVAHTD